MTTANGVHMSDATYRWIIGLLIVIVFAVTGFSAQIGWNQVQANTMGISEISDRQISIETKVDLLLSRDTN
jgi:hypothetical protein